MLMNERVMIDTRKYEIEDILDRYVQHKIVFCNHNNYRKKHKEKLKTMIQALAKGIPFPPVYASELQTGELLILDKSNKLRLLLEQLQDEFLMEEIGIDRYMIRQVLYAPLMVYVIDYINPRYIHMQVGNFIEEWKPTQEQEVRNVLYQEAEIEIFERKIEKTRYTRRNKLFFQYQLNYFMMAFFIKSNKLNDSYIKEEWDKYQLLEIAIDQIKYFDLVEWDELYSSFENCCELIEKIENCRFNMYLPETKMKYLCFLHLSGTLYNKTKRYGDGISFQKKIKEILEQCDMSYRSIIKTVDILEKEIVIW